MKDLLWQKYEQHVSNEGVTKKRKQKLSMCYNAIGRELDFNTAARPEIEKFIIKLNDNKFKKIDGTDYSGRTKQDFKKFLKQFYKWHKGNNELYPPEVSWIRTKIPKDEKPKPKNTIEYNDVIKLSQSFQKYDYKILTLILFDSGFRIQEMISAKKKDLTWAEIDEEGNKCFWVSCNLSKTFTRNIPIPLFTTEIKAFYESSFYQSKSADDPLFDISYFYYNRALKESSKKLFKKEITPHCLRHSSATYYAKKYNGNVPMLAQRYGWTFSAQELATYVRTSGAYNKEGAKLVFKNDILKLKEENMKLREDFEALKLYIEKRLMSKIDKKKSTP